MAHPIQAKIERTRSKLLEVVADLPDETLDQAADGWTIRQILTHLLNAEEDHTGVIKIIASGELDRLPTEFNIDTHNQGRVNARGHLSRAELLTALAERRDQTIALLNSLTPDQFELSGPHPVLGEMTIDKIFRILAVHDQLHLRDIQAILEAD